MDKEKNNTVRKIWRCRLCKIGIIILVVFLLFLVLIDPILNLTVKGKIESAIVNSENGKEAKIGYLSYSVLGNNLSFSDVDILLSNNSKFSQKTISIKSEGIELDGINWFSLLFDSGVSMDGIQFDKPHFAILDSSSGEQDSTADADTTSLLTENELYEMLPEKIRPLEIDDIRINNGSLARKTISETGIVDDTLKNIQLEVRDIQIDAEPGTKKLVFAEDFELHVDSLNRKYSTSGYEFVFSNIDISSSDTGIAIEEVLIKPFISDEEFFSRQTYRTERFIVNLHNLSVKQFDLASLIKEKFVQIGEINVPEFYFEVLTDKRLPQNPVQTMATMPPELMQELGYKVNIKKISLNGQISKQASHPYFDDKAVIFFTGVKFEMNNLTNYGDEECTIDAKGNMMDAAPLEVHLAIDLTSKALNFNYYGSLGAMDARKFNDHLIIENKVRVDSGNIKKVDYNVTVRNGVSDVTVTPIYSDLKITLIDEKDKGDKSFKTFIMDFLKLRNNNPEGDDEPKIGKAQYTPKEGDTFLDFVWQSLLKGLGDVVGF